MKCIPRKKNPKPARILPIPLKVLLFWKEKMIPKINMGMAKTEMFIFKPNPATSQAVAVVPMLAPKIKPIPPARVISPALMNDIVITETSELD